MGVFFIVLAIISTIAFFCDKFSKRNEESEDYDDTASIDNIMVNYSQNDNEPSTSQIVFGALQSLGCQPELKDERTILVSYQGEIFHFDFGESPSRYTRIWDPGWAGIKTDDP